VVKTKEEIFQLAKDGKLWAGNLIAEHISSSGKIECVSPIDNVVIGYIADGNARDIDAAVKVARDTFEGGEWSQKSPSERKAVMLKFASLLEIHSEELAALDCVDAGKPITECLNTDIPATIDTFYWYG